MLKEFKEFIMRGSVLDLAVGVVIGGAFTAIVDSIVKGLITPLVALPIKLLTGNKDGEIKGLSVAFKGVVFDFDAIISAIITFLITAIVVFLIVKAANTARTMLEKEEEEVVPEVDPTQEYLKEIRDLLAVQNQVAKTEETPTATQPSDEKNL